MAIVLSGSTGIQNPLGSAAAPSESNTTNSNTGAYFPTGTTYGIATNGSNAMYIDASQNVGIGTAAPNAYGKLVIIPPSQATSVATANQLMIGENSQNTNYYAKFGYALISGTTWTGIIDTIAAGSGTNLAINPTGGNVGIGTTSPSYKLDIIANTATTSLRLGNTGNAFGLVNQWDNSNGYGNIFTLGSYGLLFGTNSTERMRIDSSGNVGIGANSGTFTGARNAILNIRCTNQITTNAYANMIIQTTTNQAIDVGATIGLGGVVVNGGDNTPFAYIGGKKENSTSGNYAGYFAIYTQDAGATVSERMRIDSTGFLLLGTTTASASNTNGIVLHPFGNSTLFQHANGVASGTGYMAFIYNGSGIGSITQNGTTAVAFNTSSDYRLKENVRPMTNALTTIGALNPVIYDWISDKSQGEGFIAHELQAVIPLAVTGEKDAVDDEGKPIHQGVDYSKIVVHLVAALQELTAEVTALKAKVGA